MNQRPNTPDLRILVIFPNLPLWGSERANIEVLDELQQRGAKVRFLLRREFSESAIQPELRLRGLDYGFIQYIHSLRHHQGLKLWLLNIQAVLLGSLGMLHETRSFNASHIHISSTFSFLCLLPALLVTTVPVIFRAGDVPPQHHWLFKFAWCYANKRSASIVCISNFVKQRLIQLGANPDKCVVFYPCPPSRGLGSLLESEAQHPSVYSHEPATSFLYVGQISHDKGVHLLVDAAINMINRGSDLKVLIAGDWQFRNPFGCALVEKVKVSGLQDKISFLGYCSEILTLYASVQVHVAPSICEEALGNTVLESKAQGRPSIVMPSGGLPELVENGVDGLICRDVTSAALEEALSFYIANPEQIHIHGAAAQRSLQDRLEVHRFGERWEAVYRSVMV